MKSSPQALSCPPPAGAASMPPVCRARHRRQIPLPVSTRLPPCKSRCRRPLGDLNAAMRDLDADGQEVQALLDQGKLVGFNISVHPKRRASLRILTQSVDHYWKTGRSFPSSWPEVARLVLPAEKNFLLGRDIERSLNCDPCHVGALIRSGLLSVVKRPRCGHGGSALVTRSSFEAFLRERMV